MNEKLEKYHGIQYQQYGLRYFLENFTVNQLENETHTPELSSTYVEQIIIIIHHIFFILYLILSFYRKLYKI